jgi:hypothetical protein
MDSVKLEDVEDASAAGTPCEPLKKVVYLIDMDSMPNALQSIIEKENVDQTIIYCFCNRNSPKVSLASLERYSTWIQKRHLHIIDPPPTKGSSSIPSGSGGGGPAAASQGEGYNVSIAIAFWVGKLLAEHKGAKWFISSNDTSLYQVVLRMREAGCQVESSWPELESVQCDDEILYRVLRAIQHVKTPPPSTLDGFMEFLRRDCKLPIFISIESVVRQLQDRGFVLVHRGQLHFELPVFLEQKNSRAPSVAPSRAPSTMRSGAHTGAKASVPRIPPPPPASQSRSRRQVASSSPHSSLDDRIPPYQRSSRQEMRYQ